MLFEYARGKEPSELIEMFRVSNRFLLQDLDKKALNFLLFWLNWLRLGLFFLRLLLLVK